MCVHTHSPFKEYRACPKTLAIVGRRQSFFSSELLQIFVKRGRTMVLWAPEKVGREGGGGRVGGGRWEGEDEGVRCEE